MTVHMPFCGLETMQAACEYELWEHILNEHQELRGLVEIGTGSGGFASYLDTQARYRGLLFVTLDVKEPQRKVPGFVRSDVFADSEFVCALLRALHPVLLFCDNGDKPAEVALYGPQLQPGDLLAVHDWNAEISLDDIPSRFRAAHTDWCEDLGSQTRFFEVTDA